MARRKKKATRVTSYTVEPHYRRPRDMRTAPRNERGQFKTKRKRKTKRREPITSAIPLLDLLRRG